jgi:hypothetical protein
MNWLNQHLQAIKLVLSRMDSNKLSTFMISLVIAVAMAIPRCVLLRRGALIQTKQPHAK